jgi:hypothetical protein
MSSGIHMGIPFYVWNGQQGWFWLIVNGRDDAGIVGAAAKEADAIQEAQSSIEEMSSNRQLAERRQRIL